MTEPPRLSPLPSGLSAALRPVREAAAPSGIRLALVGGVVRDRLLGRPLAREADVAVEGRAADLARRVAEKQGERTGAFARLQVHERFDTATVENEGWRIDLAGTRRENYPHPGALPEVSPASLEDDLRRRDFTVNAMAYVLPRPGHRSVFLDPFDGRGDLAGRRLRTLHEASFRDDPTRGFRAARYANRIGFAVERRTRRLLREAVESGTFDAVSGDRIRRELEKIFAEPRVRNAVRLLESLGLARVLHPSLHADLPIRLALGRAGRLGGAIAAGTTWMMPLLLWSASLLDSEMDVLADRLSISGAARAAFLRWPETRRLLAGSQSSRGRVSDDERIAAALLAGPGAEAGKRLLSPPPELSIRGADLLRAGISAGPRVGLALARTRAARIEGRIQPADELAFAIAAAREPEEADR